MNQTNSLSQDFSDLSVGDPNASLEVTFPDTTSTLTRVSRERDVFTNDHHQALDAKILKAFSAFRTHHEEPHLPALLFHITGGDERLVALTEDKAEELLTREPSIRTVLQDAWKEGSFDSVRQLGVPGMRFLPMF